MRGSDDCRLTDQSFHTIYTLAADRTRCDARNIDYKALTGATGIRPLSSRGKPKVQAGPRKMQEEKNTRFTNQPTFLAVTKLDLLLTRRHSRNSKYIAFR